MSIPLSRRLACSAVALTLTGASWVAQAQAVFRITAIPDESPT